MVFQIGVILLSTIEGSCKTESVTCDDILFTMINELDRPVLAFNFFE